jgi:MoCo/4Fe-4S cofactor protein with predicted Tat translocation signal
MKTIPPSCPEPETGPRYWRSLDQLAETPGFRQWLEREFPAGASEFSDPVSRRHFVKIMSASFLLAGVGLTGCRRPEEKILPFGKMPENYLHGVPQFYATAMPSRSSAIPLVVKTHDGRPTKIEGNALHPDSNGSTDAFAQASILNLYDPDRAIRYAQNGTNVARDAALEFLNQLSGRVQANGGQGLSFLLERSSSPSRARLQRMIAEKLPKARAFIYEPIDFDIHRQAATLALGKPVRPYFQIDEAKVILSLDCDFMGTEEDAFINIRRFVKGRRISKPLAEQAQVSMSRLYAVEGVYTVTGANADHRLRVPTSGVGPVAAALAAQVTQDGAIRALAGRLPLPAGVKPEWIAECARDLLAHPGAALAVAGHRQPLAVHCLAYAINAALGSLGKTVLFHEAPQPKEGTLTDLAQALNAGEVETLVILGGNPVYNAPADLKWAETQRKARTVVRLGYSEDETFPACNWHLPQAHYLESWGDARTADGTLVSIQPLIAPLFDGLTELEVLARIGGLPRTNPHDLVRETFAEVAGGNDEDWKIFLHDGFLAKSAAKPVTVQFNPGNAGRVWSEFKALPAPTRTELEVVFHRDYSVDDGRFNNNGWLQETPDPISKLTWENAVFISPKTAEDLGLGGAGQPSKGRFHNPVVAIDLNGRKVEGAMWIQPGLADNTVALALGYGRERTGRIGRLLDGRPAGFNAYQLRVTGAEHFAGGAKLTIKAGSTYELATTQEHWAMEGRPIVREATADQYEKHPEFAKHMDLDSPAHTAHIPKDPKQPQYSASLYPHPEYNGLHQWGMSIDLTACVGCAACVVACQSENNVPIVGKEMVWRGREMSWIRLDRYYAGDIHDPQVAFQLMLCQHCENAPCESVCPVNATVHDNEGLNLMTYNRCVGTRYCSNNCPYKVRRFNYFDYNRRPLDKLYSSPLTSVTEGEWELKRWFKEPEKGSKKEDEWELLKLVRNPDVTVRMRGVMEKCTFCIQRIQQAKIAQKVKAGASGDVRVPDGMIKTACQQACPAEAIVFGDISDTDSRVSQLKKQERDYQVLGFLNTRPRLTYLARIRNPNPRIPDLYHESPATLEEYSRLNGSPLETHGEPTVPESTTPPGAKKGLK